MQYEVVILPSCAVQILYNNDDDGFALLDLKWIYGTALRCVGPGQTGGTCVCMCPWNLKVLLVFDAVWGRNLTLMCYFICCPNTLQWRWRLCIDLKWMHGTMLCWPWSNSTYVCIAACVHGCYWCSINVVRGRNFTLMCCPNTLQ